MIAEDTSGSRRQQILIGVAVVVILVAAVVAWRSVGGSSAADLAAERAHKCSECGHVFEYVLKMGDLEPFECPECDRRAAYKAEACYWTKDENGEWKAKLDPTYVLVKQRVDPTTNEKTYCPDCGREVVQHNRPPPSKLMQAAWAEAGK